MREAEVAAIAVPTLLYSGTCDEPETSARTANLMPNARFVALDGLDRMQAFTYRDMIMPHVLAFLAEVEAMPA